MADAHPAICSNHANLSSPGGPGGAAHRRTWPPVSLQDASATRAAISPFGLRNWLEGWLLFTEARAHGALITLVTTSPEAALREMLALDTQLHSLEVIAPALEDAFLALTSKAQ